VTIITYNKIGLTGNKTIDKFIVIIYRFQLIATNRMGYANGHLEALIENPALCRFFSTRNEGKSVLDTPSISRLTLPIQIYQESTNDKSNDTCN